MTHWEKPLRNRSLRSELEVTVNIAIVARTILETARKGEVPGKMMNSGNQAFFCTAYKYQSSVGGKYGSHKILRLLW